MLVNLAGVVGYRPTTNGLKRQACYMSGSGMVPMTTSRDTAGEPIPGAQ